MGAWLILTGEYPPKLGGVSDYTRNLAVGLTRAGEAVEVFAPPAGAPLARDPGVRVHLLPDHYGPRSLVFLERALARRPGGRLLVQYVPQGFGMRGMNVPFSLWLATRRRPVWIMFHEVAVAFGSWRSPKHNALALVTQFMARRVAGGAERIFISTPGWRDYLHGIAPRAREPLFLPIPSNLPESVAPVDALRARERLGLGADDRVLATFGSQTYVGGAAELLAGALVPLLAGDKRRVALLMGRGSVEFARRVFVGSARGARVFATGPIPLEQVAAHLASATAALQPFLDGVSSRRTSAMAGLALGVPLVTNAGPWSEPFWTGDVVGLAPEPTVASFLAEAARLLEDDARRAAVASSGRALYRRMFSLERVIALLRAEADACAGLSPPVQEPS
jgi:glycosyltransferase involved in cell wall biosynthesis